MITSTVPASIQLERALDLPEGLPESEALAELRRIADENAVRAARRLIDNLSPEETALVAQDLPLDVVYEDAELAVVNKAAGSGSAVTTSTARMDIQSQTSAPVEAKASLKGTVTVVDCGVKRYR